MDEPMDMDASPAAVPLPAPDVAPVTVSNVPATHESAVSVHADISRSIAASPTATSKDALSAPQPSLTAAPAAQFAVQYSVSVHTRPISCVKFAPSGRLLASSSADNSIKLINVDSRRVVRSLDGHSHGVSHCAWSPDGAFLASSSDDTTLRVWDVATGAQLCKPLRGHSNYVFCAAFSPRIGLLASGSFDESVRLWDLRSARCVRVIAAHSEPVTAAHFNADGTMVMTSSYDGLVRFWDTASGQCLKTLQDDTTPPVANASFTPNCRFVLAATLDSRLRLWDVLSGKPCKTYTGHVNRRLCTASCFITTRTRQAVLIGGEDAAAHVYDLQSRRNIGKLTAPGLGGDTVLAVDAHPELDVIATAHTSEPYAVHVWSDASLGNGLASPAVPSS